jgi:integrase
MRRGWLKNPKRRERRDNANTVTDQDALELIRKIDKIPEYISTKLKPETLDLLVRLRDKSMVAVNWIWFKRGNEVLKLKRKDIALTDNQLLVTFTIQKKQRSYKICPNCETRNGASNKYCRECKTDLRHVTVTKIGDKKVVTKRKTLRNKFTKHVVAWLNEFEKLTELNEISEPNEAWFFPSLRVVFDYAYFDFHSAKPMSIQNWDRILKRLDSRMTSCLFRYGGAEKYLALGYSERALQKIGDWESIRMPALYAERKGLSEAEKRFAEDTR